MQNIELAGGKGPVTEDHREIDPRTGQQKGYIVLTQEERKAGHVRPVRTSYVHVGPKAPEGLRNLTDDEKEQYSKYAYVKYQPYPESESPVVGKYWTQDMLNRLGKGCGQVTKISQDIAETFARDPHFYGGTFCCGCREHLPLDEFVWDGTEDRVGS